MRRTWRAVGLVLAALVAAVVVPTEAVAAGESATAGLVPRPVAAESTGSDPFTVTENSGIVARGAARAVGEYLGELLRPATGYRLPVTSHAARRGDIVLDLGVGKAPEGHAAEGYRLVADERAVTISADTPAGLFLGVQTLRQLLPAWVGSRTRVDVPWRVRAVRISDYPRFAYRGVMLDVARSFLSVAEVERYIDTAVQVKVNTLHLHLTDDQAWRIAIDQPADNPSGLDYGALTRVGSLGATDVLGNGTPLGTGPGVRGSYSRRDYAEIVAHARSRFVTVVPEIDGPGHTNAALASIARLNPDDVAKPMNNTANVGYSTLDATSPVTYEFLHTVLTQVAALTPGPYLHIGGDEATATGHDNYLNYVRTVLPEVAALGKLPMGWNEYAAADLPPGAVVQFWRGSSLDQVIRQAARGAKVVMSPAGTSYLDQKYDPTSPIGLNWACRDACDYDRYYDWNPVPTGLSESDVLGVCGPLWSETIRGLAQAEWLSYPRLASLAEIGWTPQSDRALPDFTARLAALGSRLTIAGVNFRPSPTVPWVTDVTAPTRHSRTVRGEVARFTSAVTPTATVDFGDGASSSAIVNAASPGGPLAAPGLWTATVAEHRYAHAGTYRATIAITTPTGVTTAHFTVHAH
ncbi:beta-N-acetylhexosaminidase [Actinokineospora inagensis]|uniref:beta-N-acetylhexosaminidase n=1 Tax=Actinokineospora inagensis TaxID=103730 RepID=UPI00042195FE|nr:beta-N-acetylhexosaminidase [Actinokineospora inagensis]